MFSSNSSTVSGDANFVEDVFSTYLYTGTGAAQTIENGINLGNVGGGSSVKFNGTSGGFGRTSKPVGAVDTKTMTFSVWLYPTLPNVSQMGILWAGPFNIIMGTAGGISIIGYPDSGNPAFYGNLNSAAITFGAWNHILFSVDTNGANTSKRHVYVNDVNKTADVTWYDGSGWFTDAAVNFDYAIWNVGQMSIVGQTWVGRITEMFLDTTYRDLSVEANRRIFYTSAGVPTTNLASLNPLIYLPMNTVGTDPGLNLGTGGNFSNNIGAVSTQTFGPFVNVGKGGMVWQKSRNTVNSYAHRLSDTNRGAGNTLRSESTAASAVTGGTSSFTSTGFTLVDGESNQSTDNYVSWTFRKQPKFFDVVTWTGTSSGSSTRAIPHNLGSTPGFIVVKVLNATSDWVCYHRSLGSDTIRLNATSAASSVGDWGTIDSSVFTVTNAGNGLNFLGQTYVAYLFAHDAGGFGLAGTDNVVSCGSYTGNGSASGPVIDLNYEPQFVIVKNASAFGSWQLLDTMRGLNVSATDATINPNLSSAESVDQYMDIFATGFQLRNGGGNWNTSGATYIYIAIRRGPMKVPTDGTKVFKPLARTGTGGATDITGVGFSPDLVHTQSRDSYGANGMFDRLRGAPGQLRPASSAAEQTTTDIAAYLMDGVATGGSVSYINDSGIPYSLHFFKRAPGFMDEVCYKGIGGDFRDVLHNLSVVPEFILIKNRSGNGDWAAEANITNTNHASGNFNSAGGLTTYSYASGIVLYAKPSASTLFIAGGAYNQLDLNYVAYLFATCPGVSKVGSYTGTAATQVIDCGFTAGARFVLIKRTDSTGDWYVWDSARGIIAGNDPYLLINSLTAEVTSTDYIDPVASGFEISSTAPAAINASGGSFIFLAIS